MTGRSAPAVLHTGGSSRAVVSVDGVWKRFGATDVVSDLSFELAPGEILGFLGPNGAGKTTTMRMILDIIRPDRGSIAVFGSDPGVKHQGRVGYLPEERGLYRDVPVLDTLAYFGALRGMRPADARRRAAEILEAVGLGDAMNKKAAELSRGMHQKVQVVATILHDPDLLVIDEPFQGLDPLNADMLRNLVLAQRDRGASVIMSTHGMTEAETVCDRILLIDRGRRLLFGTLDEIRRGFSDGAVIVRGAAVPRDAAAYRSATEVQEVSGAVRFVLRDGASPRDLFRELAATDASVERFEVATPSLGEIFIRTVEGDRRAIDIGTEDGR